MDKYEIIERIAKARNKVNLSARKLSQQIEMNDSYINRMESKKDFLPSIEVLLRIISECNMTVEQFFYYDMDAYENDKQIIKRIKKLTPEKKNAILTVIDSME